MASYTIELRKVCEYYTREVVEGWFKNYNLADYLTLEQIQSITSKGVWSKEKLAKKIVDHYYMREIGFETPALFEHYVKMKMQEIMEDYLPVIYSNSIEFDPLVNVDFTETFEREIEGSSENEGTSNSNSSSNGSGLNIINNTPETRIEKQNLESGLYASQVNQSETESQIEDETTTSNSGSTNQTESYTKRTKGNSGVSATAQALIQQYRETIRAVDREIIENLNDLFMGIY